MRYKVVKSEPLDMWDPNGWTMMPSWKTLSLSRDGEIYTIVDEDKYDELMAEGPWHLYEYGSKRYARRTRRKGERHTGVAIYMHRVLAARYLPQPSKSHIIVDHIRSDGLDNRLSMLRWCTPRDNRLNVNGMWWQQKVFLKELESDTQTKDFGSSSC